MSATPAPSTMPQVTIGSVVRAGTVAGIIAGILCALMWAIGKLFGTEFQVSVGNSDQLTSVTFVGAFLLPVVVGALSALFAALLFRRPSGFLWVLLIGFALTFLSLLAPLFQPSDVTWPTRLWLVAMHLVTGVIIVPVVAIAVAARSMRLMNFGRPQSVVIVDGVVISDDSASGQTIQGEVIESHDDLDGPSPRSM